MTIETWALLGVNSVLLGITSFFIKQWINQVKDSERENRDDFQKHKEDNCGKSPQIKNVLTAYYSKDRSTSSLLLLILIFHCILL